MSLKLAKLRGQHIGQDSRGQPGCIGIDQEKERAVTEEPAAQPDQGMDAVLNFPDLPLGASSVGGRVHDNGIVMVTPADLPLHELYAVVHDPADRGL